MTKVKCAKCDTEYDDKYPECTACKTPRVKVESLIRCRHCGGEISATSTECGLCGKKDPFGSLIFVQLAFAAVVVAAIFSLVQCTSGESKRAGKAGSIEEVESNVRYACSRFVERLAHDPKSIQWEGRPDWNVRRSADGSWGVDMTFRAKNAFGALVLNRKTCTVKVNGDDVTLMGIH